MIRRRKTRVIKIGNVRIGGAYPVAIQSMTKVKTSDIEETIKQIGVLEEGGCEIVRVALKDDSDAKAIRKLKQNTTLPIVADIHFDWRLALEAIDNGVDKIRLNPGNIYRKKHVKEIVSAAKLNNIPIRVGVNSGSVKSVSRLAGLPVRRLNRTTVQPANRLIRGMINAALNYIRLLEKEKFYNIVISLKSSTVLDTIAAYRKLSRLCDYPMHLGVTATGSVGAGTIKSSIALGLLLEEGIGDTIRVSLTEDPAQEVRVAKVILESLGLRSFGPQIISCPTCGRCEVDLIKIVKDLENRLSAFSLQPFPRLRSGQAASILQHRPIKVAIMGCVVNGPGEAKEADIGVAFGRKEGLLFRKGKPVRKVSFGECVDVLIGQICSGQKTLYRH